MSPGSIVGIVVFLGLFALFYMLGVSQGRKLERLERHVPKIEPNTFDGNLNSPWSVARTGIACALLVVVLVACICMKVCS